MHAGYHRQVSVQARGRQGESDGRRRLGCDGRHMHGDSCASFFSIFCEPRAFCKLLLDRFGGLPHQGKHSASCATRSRPHRSPPVHATSTGSFPVDAMPRLPSDRPSPGPTVDPASAASASTRCAPPPATRSASHARSRRARLQTALQAAAPGGVGPVTTATGCLPRTPSPRPRWDVMLRGRIVFSAPPLAAPRRAGGGGWQEVQAAPHWLGREAECMRRGGGAAR